MEELSTKKIVMMKILTIFISIVLVIVIALVIIRNVLFFSCEIVGDSMEPNLHDGEYGLVMKKKFTKITRGSIVVIDNGDELIVKRVVGLPGETISLDSTNSICINGEVMEEGYLEKGAKSYNSKGNLVLGASFTMGEKEYYCLGDNRSVSLDSRYLGPISYDKIEGVLKIIIGTCKNDTCSSRSYSSPRFF